MAKNIQDRPVLEQSSPRQALLEDYLRVRRFSEQLCVPLVTEDYVIQSMPDVSPTRWHLAHTSWFFETFVLSSYTPDYTSPYPQYAYLFNSYYNSVGERHCRPKRGLISRPTVQETYAYRRYVDDCVSDFLSTCTDETLVKAAPVVTLGIHHEQQHQELMVTDIKHVLSCNPLHPVYQKQALSSVTPPSTLGWISYPEQLAWIGYDGDGFFYDNEGPYHREFVDAYQLGSRLITNGEYLQFIEDGGYQNPLLWLSSGWNTVQGEQWQAPLYWEKHDGQWMMMTLSGLRPVEPAEPVCHVSYYEADAYARWADARLATEAEWELASRQVPIEGNFVENQQFHPVPLEKAVDPLKLEQMYGDVWEWTQSAYLPYRGYRPAPGALGEYNGKFMCNQFVLRGGSCATSITHIRPTYRNFFPPDARWQFMGIRLAREV